MTSPAWMQPADERILEHLDENPPDYVPLVANRLGLHLAYAERRVEVLVERGFLEPVTGESIYDVTDAGERYVAGEFDASTLEASSDD